MHQTQALVGSLLAWWSGTTERGRREADRAVVRQVFDPAVAIDRAAARRLSHLRSPQHRAALADAIRRNIALGCARLRLAPPAARLLAGDAERAQRIADRLELADPDPRAVIETERLLESGKPSRERLEWIDRLLSAQAA